MNEPGNAKTTPDVKGNRISRNPIVREIGQGASNDQVHRDNQFTGAQLSVNPASNGSDGRHATLGKDSVPNLADSAAAEALTKGSTKEEASVASLFYGTKRGLRGIELE